jgi:hypothetical protein
LKQSPLPAVEEGSPVNKEGISLWNILLILRWTGSGRR